MRFPTIYDRYIFVDFDILLDVLDQVCIWLAIMVPGTTTTWEFVIQKADVPIDTIELSMDYFGPSSRQTCGQHKELDTLKRVVF